MVENKFGKSFQCGDVVFAKSAGYPPWPSKIIKIDAKQNINVLFFATGIIATVDVKNIYAYADYKEFFNGDQEMMRIKYDEAVEQAERALSVKHSAGLALPQQQKEQNSQAALFGDPSTEVLPAMVGKGPEMVLTNGVEPKSMFGTYIKPKADGPKVEEPEPFKFKVPKAVKWNFKRKPFKLPQVEEPDKNPNPFEASTFVRPWLNQPSFNVVPKEGINGAAAAPPDVEAVRAAAAVQVGRKRPPSPTEDISSDDSNEAIPIKRVLNEAIAAERPKEEDQKEDKDDAATPIDGKREIRSHIIKNNFLLVYMPTAKCYGIDLTFQKPHSFPNSAAEDDWMRNSREEAIVLKLKMLSGIIDLDSMPGRIVCDPKRDMISENESLQFLTELGMQTHSLLKERCFVLLTRRLRNSLGLRRANTDQCLELLKELKSIKFNKLLLLRNPQCVDIIRRLRVYVGNLPLWNLSAAEEKAFKKQTRLIRHKAYFIYFDMAYTFFPTFQANVDFWTKYCERVLVFQDYIAKHGPQGLLGNNQSN